MARLKIESVPKSDYLAYERSNVLFLGAGPPGRTAEYRGLTLRSVFQAIGGVVRGSVVGYEALLRATTQDGRPVQPPKVLEEARGAGELLLLNQIVSDLHIANFSRQDPGNCWLFLNISTPVLSPMITNSGNLSILAAKHGIPPSRIVVEVLEQDILDDRGFERCLRKYKDAGFIVAMDDFGKGWSNLDRIFNFFPSIVKFDLGLISRARSNRKVQRAYHYLTAMLHEVGIMVLAEGIESVEDASFMVEAGVDFLQGHWLSRPHPSPRAAHVARKHRELRTVYGARVCRSDQADSNVRAAVEITLRQAAEVYATTGDIVRAAAIFNAVPYARRLVVLDKSGFDVGVIFSTQVLDDALRHEQLMPLQPSRSSRFTHRKYFRDAIRYPNQVHFESPVYSLLDDSSCDVVAKAVTREGALFVVCGAYVKP